jgi:hypothetical protein
METASDATFLSETDGLALTITGGGRHGALALVPCSYQSFDRFTMPTIGKLLGDTQDQAAQHYAYLLDAPLRAGLELIGDMLRAKPRPGQQARTQALSFDLTLSCASQCDGTDHSCVLKQPEWRVESANQALLTYDTFKQMASEVP